MKIFQVKTDDAMLARMDALAERLAAEKGVRCTRADVFRHGVAELERRYTEPKPKKTSRKSAE